jgi:hypothetical protein
MSSHAVPRSAEELARLAGNPFVVDGADIWNAFLGPTGDFGLRFGRTGTHKIRAHRPLSEETRKALASLFQQVKGELSPAARALFEAALKQERRFADRTEGKPFFTPSDLAALNAALSDTGSLRQLDLQAIRTFVNAWACCNNEGDDVSPQEILPELDPATLAAEQREGAMPKIARDGWIDGDEMVTLFAVLGDDGITTAAELGWLDAAIEGLSAAPLRLTATAVAVRSLLDGDARDGVLDEEEVEALELDVLDKLQSPEAQWSIIEYLRPLLSESQLGRYRRERLGLATVPLGVTHPHGQGPRADGLSSVWMWFHTFLQDRITGPWLVSVLRAEALSWTPVGQTAARLVIKAVQGNRIDGSDVSALWSAWAREPEGTYDRRELSDLRELWRLLRDFSTERGKSSFEAFLRNPTVEDPRVRPGETTPTTEATPAAQGD